MNTIVKKILDGEIVTALKPIERLLIKSELETETIAFKLMMSFRDELDEKLKEIQEYCEPHASQMWAARILGIITDKDFRDAATKSMEKHKGE